LFNVPLYSQGLIYTGSHDKYIRAYHPGSVNALFEMEGHGDTVSAIFVSPKTGTLISGSWDKTAKVWVDQLKPVMTLNGHEAAVWAVAILPRNGLMVTGSADKQIILWQAGQPKVKVPSAHSQAVRDVAVLSDDTFISGSNDSTVKVWRVTIDDNDVKMNCLHTLETPNDNFVYTMSVLSAGGEDNAWVVGGEGSGIMVFKEGKISQELQVPAISIWKVIELPNGDIAAGCSDGKIWLFTRDPNRKAPDDLMVGNERMAFCITML
jgi:phospholipase A-2-activating protein